MSVILIFFDHLNQHGISYCHMKGTERHLKTMVDGSSDVDILVDIHQRTSFQALMESSGLKRFIKVSNDGENDDVEDYFQLDLHLNRLIHWHIHYRIPLGPPFNKSIRTGFESVILDGRVFNKQYNSFCIAPVHDIILLFCKEALSMRTIFGFPLDQPRQKTIEDYMALRNQIPCGSIEDELNRLLQAPASVLEAIKTGFTKQTLSRLAPRLSQIFGQTGNYTAFSLISLYKGFSFKVRRKWRSVTQPEDPLKRISPRGGRAIVVFCDTKNLQHDLEKSLNELFAKKIDCHLLNLREKNGWSRLQKIKANKLIAIGCIHSKATIDKSLIMTLEKYGVDKAIAVFEDARKTPVNIFPKASLASIPARNVDVSGTVTERVIQELWKVL